jgi:hypothetical protein
MTTRKENGVWLVREALDVNRYDFDGTAEELKANIDLVVEKARAMGMVGEGWFDLDLTRGYYDGGDDVKITYNFDRAENEKEKATREKAAAKRKETAAAKRKATAEAKKLKADAEYAEFLRLKEKFEVLNK